MTTDVEDLLRQLAPQVLGAVVRRYGNFDSAEDATQEALIAAAAQWPAQGVPAYPKGWLITVASRRLADLLRAHRSRLAREHKVDRWNLPGQRSALGPDHPVTEGDDTLILLFMCCHPALSTASQIALTLRAVGGLTTGEVARALLVSEATVTRRITRAKQTIRDHGTRFTMPTDRDRDDRLRAVLHVLYLIFNEGYASTTGPSLQRVELADEAIRLTRLLRTVMPDDSETSGLLALMVLTHARRDARIGPNGELVTMADQDRTRWNRDLIDEGVDLITTTLPRGPVGPYQLQAAIAAIHDEASTSDETDWPQIVQLYEVLLRAGDNPIVALNHAVAVAMSGGPQAGLTLLDDLSADDRVNDDHRYHAVRGHLLEMTGDARGAASCYERAAERTTNFQQKRYLQGQAARLAPMEEPT
jgi:RNA polymerase sigma factor (sigma-70 family)